MRPVVSWLSWIWWLSFSLASVCAVDVSPCTTSPILSLLVGPLSNRWHSITNQLDLPQGPKNNDRNALRVDHCLANQYIVFLSLLGPTYIVTSFHNLKFGVERRHPALERSVRFSNCLSSRIESRTEKLGPMCSMSFLTTSTHFLSPSYFWTKAWTFKNMLWKKQCKPSWVWQCGELAYYIRDLEFGHSVSKQINYKYMCSYKKRERWLIYHKHLLLLQRTGLGFSAPTWELTITCNYSPEASSSTSMHMVYVHTHIQNIHKIKINTS